jgi:hypothetical protein
VRQLRTGLSWADSFRPDADRWFDRVMHALDDFDVTVTFCFTPAHLGLAPHHTSPAADPQGFADFCSWMIDRYAPAGSARVAAPSLVAPQSDSNVTPFVTLHLDRDERLAAERSAA